jgi:hypothetical protein
MAEPHSTAAAAALTGTAAAIPAAGIAAALGVPLDLLGWAMFGGLVALANTEPKQPPREGVRLAVNVAMRLAIAAGIGGAFAPIAGEILVALSGKAGVILTPGPVLLRAASILLGFGTAFIPEAMRLARSKLGGPQP